MKFQRKWWLAAAVGDAGKDETGSTADTETNTS